MRIARVRVGLLRRIAFLRWSKRSCFLWLLLLVYMIFSQDGRPVLPHFSLILVVWICIALQAWEFSLRRQFVREASLPRFLTAKLIEHYPQLSERDAELVLRGLRQFFLSYLRSGRKFVAMPSKVVDTAWHECILYTQAYERWCDAAFGRFLHHSPAEVLGRDAGRNDGLRRVWYWACKEENIDPRNPSRLPLIFALDKKFAIAGGFIYAADCSSRFPYEHCGTSFGGGAGGDGASGDSSGFGGSERSSDGSGSGCGGGCGGGD